jgi:hypothetical protein
MDRKPLDESHQRGCQEKFFPLPLRREMDVVALYRVLPLYHLFSPRSVGQEVQIIL